VLACHPSNGIDIAHLTTIGRLVLEIERQSDQPIPPPIPLTTGPFVGPWPDGGSSFGSRARASDADTPPVADHRRGRVSLLATDAEHPHPPDDGHPRSHEQINVALGRLERAWIV
jgi:hypothetical protein